MLKITGGIFKSRSLQQSSSHYCRATSSRVREALFSTVGAFIQKARFCDLYAGNGTIGFEALSRGAQSVVMVESHHAQIRIIQRNTSALGISKEQCRVIRSDVAVFLAREKRNKYDIIFLDPPYAADEYTKTLQEISRRSICTDDGIIIAEHDKRIIVQPPDGMHITKTMKYGDTQLSYIKIKKV